MALASLHEYEFTSPYKIIRSKSDQCNNVNYQIVQLFDSVLIFIIIKKLFAVALIQACMYMFTKLFDIHISAYMYML